VTVQACDICKKVPALRIYVTTGREMDGAGSMEDTQVCQDLCDDHIKSRLDMAIQMLDFDQRRRLLAGG